MDTTRTLNVAIRCDALARFGTGHLVRQTALMQELHARGHRARLFGECDVPWAAAQAEAVGVPFEAPEEDFAAQAVREGTDVVIVDGYEFDASLAKSCQDAGLGVLAMVDGPFGRHQSADIYVDQNLGSEDPGGDEWLVGPKYVLLRDVVLRQKDAPRPEGGLLRVLVVFGGSDPFGGAPVAVGLLACTGIPMEIVAIAASQERRAELASVKLADGQRLEVLGAQDDLPALAATCDFCVSASGTSVWEFACMGVPTGLVCVTDNQITGYEAATEELAVGVGHLEALRADDAARTLAIEALTLLASAPEHRAKLRDAGRALVDGEGRARVVDAMEQLSKP